MLVRMYRNESLWISLMGLQNGTAAVEHDMASPQKEKVVLLSDSENVASG